MTACDFGSCCERAAWDALSQRRETPFSRRVEATLGRMVLRAAGSMSRVSTELQAAV